MFSHCDTGDFWLSQTVCNMSMRVSDTCVGMRVTQTGVSSHYIRTFNQAWTRGFDTRIMFSKWLQYFSSRPALSASRMCMQAQNAVCAQARICACMYLQVCVHVILMRRLRFKPDFLLAHGAPWPCVVPHAVCYACACACVLACEAWNHETETWPVRSSLQPLECAVEKARAPALTHAPNPPKLSLPPASHQRI